MLDGRRHERVSQTPLRMTRRSRQPLCGKGRSSSTQTRSMMTLLISGGVPSNHRSKGGFQVGYLLRALFSSRSITNTPAFLSIRTRNIPLRFTSATSPPERTPGDCAFPLDNYPCIELLSVSSRTASSFLFLTPPALWLRLQLSTSMLVSSNIAMN